METPKYICPVCKKEQKTAIQWQTASNAYEFNLKTRQSEEVDQITGDHEAWTCSGCGEDLPPRITNKIGKWLGWA